MSPVDNLMDAAKNKKRRGFKEQLHSLKFLLKNSVTIVGDNREIMYPFVAMVVYNFVVATLSFMGIAFLFFGNVITILMGIAMIGFAILLWVYEFFFFAYQKTRLSWLIYEMLCGRERSFSDARKHTSQLKSQIRKIALLDMLKTWIQSQKSSRGGIMSTIINLAIAGLAKVIDLAKHYMLPAVAIDGLGVRETIEQMKTLKERVPETLVGMFGVDILGNIVIKLIAPVYILIGAIGVALSVAMGWIFPSFMVIDLDGLAIAWPVLLAMLFFIKSISILLSNLTACLKVSYFTTFYTEITHREELTPKLQAELESFLKLEEDANLHEALPTS